MAGRTGPDRSGGLSEQDLYFAESSRTFLSLEPVAIRVATWVSAAYLALNTLGKIVSKNSVERYVWTCGQEAKNSLVPRWVYHAMSAAEPVLHN